MFDPLCLVEPFHSLVTDGLVSPRRAFVPVASPDPVRIMERFRHKLVKALKVINPLRS